MGKYTEFTNKLTVAAGDALNPTTQLNQQFQGVQDEFELRAGDGWLDGIVSGLRPVTTNGTSSLTIPAGRLYAVGKEYIGGESFTITGYPAGSYKLYYDTADDTTTLKATTASLSSAQFKLAEFTWDGAGTASNAIVLTDNGTGSKHGVVEAEIPAAYFTGQIATTSRFVIPVPRDLWIERVDSILSANNGTSGNVVFDVLLGADGAEGTTIFTTAARRPTHAALANSYTIAQSGEADGDRFPDAGEHLTIKPVQVFGNGTASNATVIVLARLR